MLVTKSEEVRHDYTHALDCRIRNFNLHRACLLMSRCQPHLYAGYGGPGVLSPKGTDDYLVQVLEIKYLIHPVVCFISLGLFLHTCLEDWDTAGLRY